MKAIKVKNHRDCGAYFYELTDEQVTWEEVLDYIGAILDEQYCNSGTTVGCTIEAEIVEMTRAQFDEIVQE